MCPAIPLVTAESALGPAFAALSTPVNRASKTIVRPRLVVRSLLVVSGASSVSWRPAIPPAPPHPTVGSVPSYPMGASVAS